jgi:competence protein ComEA
MGLVGRKLEWIDGVLGLGVVLIVAGIAVDFNQRNEQKAELIKAKVTPTVMSEAREVMVDVEGEVINPGVYKLGPGSRVNEALVAAGGLGVRADREWVEKNLNRAAMVTDGMKIYIPAKGEAEEKIGGAVVTGGKILGESGGLISINRATKEQLDELPKIGPALAGRIIDYREKNGGFRDIQELKLVSGIGEKLFEEIKDKVSL